MTQKPLSLLHVWVDSKIRSAEEHMAVDDCLMETVRAPWLRVYEFPSEYGSIGYFSSLKSARHLFPELNWVRRNTGGGMVDHRNDWTYTLVVPRDEASVRLEVKQSYAVIHARLAQVLKEEGFEVELVSPENAQCGLVCFESPTCHDLIYRVGDQWEKLAGAGQKRTPKLLLHQGSVAGRLSKEVSENRALLFAHALSDRVEKHEDFKLPFLRLNELLNQRYLAKSWLEKR